MSAVAVGDNLRARTIESNRVASFCCELKAVDGCAVSSAEAKKLKHVLFHKQHKHHIHK